MSTFPDLVAALHAPAAAPEQATALGLFGQFVGSWELSWNGYAHGRAVHAVGELHFGWVLGGRAVQDTWIVPGPGQPGAGVPPLAFHGTTVRFHDLATGVWRSTWIDPVNARVRKFVGRETDEGIELLSADEAPMLRWRFTEIRTDRFRWTGERSDDGTAWVLEDEMIAKRTAAGVAGS